jgi:hypothetical protein
MQMAVNSWRAVEQCSSRTSVIDKFKGSPQLVKIYRSDFSMDRSINIVAERFALFLNIELKHDDGMFRPKHVAVLE